MRRRPLLRRLAFAATSACLGAASCGETPGKRGGLMLMISQDGEIVDRLEIRVASSGESLFRNTYLVPSEARLPTTLAIASNGNSSTTVDITVIGWAGTVPVDRRDAIVTQIPTNRVGGLRVVLSARCSAQVKLDSEGEAFSVCGEQATCDPASGDCVSSSVDGSSLPDYHAGAEGDPWTPGMAGKGGAGRGGAGSGGTGSGGDAMHAGAAGRGAGGAAGNSSPQAGTHSGEAGTGGSDAVGGSAGANDGGDAGSDNSSGTAGAGDEGGSNGVGGSSGVGGASDSGGRGGRSNMGGSAGTGTPIGCDPECDDPTPVCLIDSCVACSPNPTATSCEDNVPQFCDESGSYQPSASGPCTGGKTCVSGACVCTQTMCGAACIDTSTNSDNCGSCSHSCQTGDCVAGKCQPVNLVFSQSSPWGIAVGGGKVYWVNQGVQSLNSLTLSTGWWAPLALPGGNCENPFGGLAVDATNLYFVARNACMLPLAGGTAAPLPSNLYTSNSRALHSIAANSSRVFVINASDNWLQSSEPSTYALSTANALAVAADDDGVYWIARTASTTSIMRHGVSMLSDGTHMAIASGFNGSNGIAVYNSYVYWTTSSSVLRVPTSGGATETVASAQTSPAGVAADASGVYWANRTSTGTIQRAPLAGGTVETLATNQNDPHGVALDATTVYWTNTAGGEVMKVAK